MIIDVKSVLYCITAKRRAATIRITFSSILAFFGTTHEEYSVVFTSGATEAIRKVGEYFDYGDSGGTLCYLNDNHTSVLGIREYALSRGVRVQCVTETELLQVPTGESATLANASSVMLETVFRSLHSV